MACSGTALFLFLEGNSGYEEACRRSRKMEGVRRGPPNAVRHHGEEKEEEEGNS
jgi:hypothetical protein